MTNHTPPSTAVLALLRQAAAGNVEKVLEKLEEDGLARLVAGRYHPNPPTKL